MKKLFFPIGLIVCTLIACSSAKNLANKTYPPPTSQANYFHSNNAISDTQGLAMIKIFPQHKYHFTHKKKLLNTWSWFDLHDIDTVRKDANVDSVKFAMASWTDKGKQTLYPTVVMVIYIKPGIEISFKSANPDSWTVIPVVNREVTATYNTVQYIQAKSYCPPPQSCTVAMP